MADDDVPRETSIPAGLRLALLAGFLLVAVAGALILVDRQIKADLVAEAQRLRQDINDHKGGRSREPEPEHAPDQVGVPDGRGVDRLELDPGASPAAPPTGRLTTGAGGLMARGPGDGTSGDGI